MSAALAYTPPLLTAHRGGPASLDLPPVRMTPGQIALTLSADVLRLPYTPATRLVLAEIVSLHAATGCCDASNTHFMARLTLKHDVVNEAIQRLHDDGLIVKVVNKAAGFYRTLTPVPAAISAKASTNPYPEKSTSYSEKPTSTPSRKSRLGYPEIPTSPSRENPLPLVGNPDTNTPLNLPSNFQEDSIPQTPAADAAAGPEKKIEAVEASHSLPTEPTAPTIAPRCEAPPKPKAPPKASTEPEHFPAFWAAWPKKEGKLDAVRAFAKLSADDQAAAASRADTWLTARPDLADPARFRFIPHASTWLNQQRWTDEAPAPSAFHSASHSHANRTSTPPSGRPQPGEKPTDAGTLLAGSLAQRRWQQRNGGPSNS